MSTQGRLAGKVALVTGAAQGIGEAIARVFAQQGARVMLSDIQVDRGLQVAAHIGAEARFQQLDVRDPASWKRVVLVTQEQLGQPDILVNNAGVGAGGPIEHEKAEDHRRLLDINVTGVWSGIRAVVPAMGVHGGSIINISSIDGLVGVEGLTSYVATKFAVTGMTRSIAIELGPRNIRVNAIHPGIIASTLVQATSDAVKARLNKAVARQPIARMGRPEEIANAALFFASDESSFCTGASLVVDGGHLAGPYRDRIED
jgi:3alpha(or 20beta)-hydroxysteroid dehydrogenase